MAQRPRPLRARRCAIHSLVRLTPLGVCHRVALKQHRTFRPRKFNPTFYRSKRTIHDPGCGGAMYHVTFAGDPLGEVFSAWSLRDGVFWGVVVGGMVVVDKGSDRPKVYADRTAATNALLASKRWCPDYGLDTEE